MFLNTQFSPDVLIILGPPSQVTDLWNDWHQTYGKDGYPAIYILHWVATSMLCVRTLLIVVPHGHLLRLPLIKSVSRLRCTM